MYSRQYNRAHTRAVIAQLRATGAAPHKRRVGRVPRPVPPTRIADEYAAAIRRHVNEQARACFEEHAQSQVLSALADLRRMTGHADSAAPQRVADLLTAIVEWTARTAGQPRTAPPIVLRPSLPGAIAFYSDARDEITIGAVPLAMLRSLCKRGRAETDADLLAIKVAVHEGLHAAARRSAVAANATGDEQRAEQAVEEATAEIAAEVMAIDAARAAGIDVSPALAARWRSPLFRAAAGDVQIARPTSYPAFVERIGRIAARAEAPDLCAWVRALRRLKGTARIGALGDAVGCARNAIVRYLAAPRTGAEAPLGGPSRAPWIASGPVQPGEIDAAARAVVLRAEAAIMAGDGGAVAAVDALGDERASFHVRCAIAQRAGGARMDAARADAGDEHDHKTEQGKRAARAIDDAARAFADAFRPHALHDVVKQFGKRTDEHGRKQLDGQLRAAIGIPLSAVEKPHRDRLDEWAALNVDLIVTIPDRYFDDLRLKVLDAFDNATAPDVLADDISDSYGTSEFNAQRIARDQTLKLSADLNHDRMQSLGVERGIWRTMHDARVSKDCAALDGTEFVLSEGVPPDGLLPGAEHPMCRCFTEPVLDDLLK